MGTGEVLVDPALIPRAVKPLKRMLDFNQAARLQLIGQRLNANKLPVSAHHLLNDGLLGNQLFLPGVDARCQWEIGRGATLGKVQLLNALRVVANQSEVLGACLMQADDIAGLAAHFGYLIPDVRIIWALL